MRFFLPRSSKILHRRHFSYIRKRGNRLTGSLLTIYLIQKNGPSKLGITASSKFGNAAERNRFKRIVREAYRKNRPYLPDRLQMVVYPRELAKKASSLEIEREIKTLTDPLEHDSTQ